MGDYCPIEIKSTLYKGLGVSPGKAVGCVCLFEEGRHNNMPVYGLHNDEDIDRELDRYQQAKIKAIEEINAVYAEVKQKLGVNEAAIFLAHKVILGDEAIDEKIEECIRTKHLNIEYCVVEVFDGYEQMIASMDNEYMKERGTDFAELKRRLLDKLGNLNPGLSCQGEPFCSQGKGRIIVAKELTPSLTVEIDCDEVFGFVTEHGGKTSHAAILANALGIPAVSGIHGLHGRLPCGTIIYIDGDKGEVWVNPPSEELEDLSSRRVPTETDYEKIPETIPGIDVKILANINNVSMARQAMERRAQGAGLVRTEYLFMESRELPDEDQQFEFYADIVRVFDGHTVTFRLLDVGGDKPVPYIHMEHEDNPYLGWRGTRFLLDNPEIVYSQVRAIARAAAVGRVEIMYPMVTDFKQLKDVRQVVRDAFEHGEWGALKIREGVMIEVPSLIFQIEDIAEEADFFSIGTNDLIQYLFAVDRNNEHVAGSYDMEHPVLWEIIEKAGAVGRAHGIPVSVCGEMAGMPRYAARFREAGVTSLSMSPRMIPRVKEAFVQLAKGQ